MIKVKVHMYIMVNGDFKSAKSVEHYHQLKKDVGACISSTCCQCWQSD